MKAKLKPGRVLSPEDLGLAQLHESFSAQVKALGQVTDLLALIAIVEDADPEALGTDPRALGRWLEGLAEARAARALAEAEEHFVVKPKSFAWPADATLAATSLDDAPTTAAATTALPSEIDADDSAAEASRSRESEA